MKNAAYIAAIVLCGILIVFVIGSMVLPPIQQTLNQKQIVGTWFSDAFDGNGGKYVTFTENGSMSLYEEVTAADGTKLYQDSQNFGTMTYEVLQGGKLRMAVTVMGVTSEETADFEIKSVNTLILGGDTYIRR